VLNSSREGAWELDLDEDTAVLKPGRCLCQHHVRNGAHLLPRQLVEDHDLVEPVKHLWPEVALRAGHTSALHGQGEDMDKDERVERGRGQP